MINPYQSNELKSIAVLMMLCLHLFNTLDYAQLFEPIIFIGEYPLIYYISLFCDACIHMFIYTIYFKEFIYEFSYPIFIFPALLFACLIGSYVVNFIIARVYRLS